MTAASDGQIVKLGFVGDICLSLGVIEVVREHGPEFVFEKMRPLFDGFDSNDCLCLSRIALTPFPPRQSPYPELPGESIDAVEVDLDRKLPVGGI